MSLTYLVLGDAFPAPGNGRLKSHPRSQPNAGALYRARMNAAMQVETEFFCLLDGGCDALLPGFEESVEQRMAGLRESGKHIAYADELANGELIASGDFSLPAYLRNPAMIHHAPVCRTASARAIAWPDGCFWFEGICYGSLARLGWMYLPGVVYEWNRTPGGASRWPSTTRALINTMLWHQGRGGVHFASDFDAKGGIR